MSQCKRFLISGRVQGVFFRASTRERAQALGLTGHAVNLPDGRVEVLACGEPDALDDMERWLWQGSSAAKVSDVVAEAVSVDAPAQFTTG